MIDFLLTITALVLLTFTFSLLPPITSLLAPFIPFILFSSLVPLNYATDFANNMGLFENPSDIHLDSYLVFETAKLFSSIFPGNAFIASILIIYLPIVGFTLFASRRYLPKTPLGLSIYFTILSCSLDPWGSYRLSVSFFFVILLSILLLAKISGQLNLSNLYLLPIFAILMIISLGFHKASLIFWPMSITLLLRMLRSPNSFFLPKSSNLLGFIFSLRLKKSVLLVVKRQRLFLISLLLPALFLIIINLVTDFEAYLAIANLINGRQILQILYLSLAPLTFLLSNRLTLFWGNTFLIQLIIYFLLAIFIMLLTGSDVVVGRLSKYLMIYFSIIIALPLKKNYKDSGAFFNHTRSSLELSMSYLVPSLLSIKQVTPLLRNLLNA